MSALLPIPVSSVRLGSDVEALVMEVIRSGMIAQGPMVARLEAEFADMIGARHVVAVNNGTTALIAALEVLDLQPGDEVITSPFTFVATLNAILAAGATARFADISIDDFNVSSASIAELVNERTKVLLPVHLYGQCADMPGIAALGEQHGLHLVEDAAQAHGAAIGDQFAGTWGVGCFSLYGTKNLTSGEGGLISTSDDALADRLRVLRNQGMRQRYQYEMAGNNYRLTDLQAAVCVPQLASYDQNVAARQRNAARLSAGLADVDGLTLPRQLAGRRHVWHQYTVLIDAAFGVARDRVVELLGEASVGCGVYYPKTVFDYDCYRSDPRVMVSDVPVAADVASRCLSLPVHQYLTDDQIDHVVEVLRGIRG